MRDFGYRLGRKGVLLAEYIAKGKNRNFFLLHHQLYIFKNSNSIKNWKNGLQWKTINPLPGFTKCLYFSLSLYLSIYLCTFLTNWQVECRYNSSSQIRQPHLLNIKTFSCITTLSLSDLKIISYMYSLQPYIPNGPRNLSCFFSPDKSPIKFHALHLLVMAL